MSCCPRHSGVSRQVRCRTCCCDSPFEEGVRPNALLCCGPYISCCVTQGFREVGQPQPACAFLCYSASYAGMILPWFLTCLLPPQSPLMQHVLRYVRRFRSPLCPIVRGPFLRRALSAAPPKCEILGFGGIPLLPPLLSSTFSVKHGLALHVEVSQFCSLCGLVSALALAAAVHALPGLRTRTPWRHLKHRSRLQPLSDEARWTSRCPSATMEPCDSAPRVQPPV